MLGGKGRRGEERRSVCLFVSFRFDAEIFIIIVIYRAKTNGS